MRLTQILVVGLILLIGHLAFADGVFMVVKGDIKVVAKGKAPVAAKVGMKINDPDKVIAGKDSRAKIVMSDKNVINISPNSEIIIEAYKTAEADGKKEVSLNVLYGKVRATVNQKYDGDKSKFQIKTPSAVAGVRGTDLMVVHYEPTKGMDVKLADGMAIPDSSNGAQGGNVAKSEVVVFEGSVSVTDENGKNSVMVGAGEITNVGANTGPAPAEKVPPTQLNAMNKDSSTDGGKRPDTTTTTDRGVANDKKEEKKEEKKPEGEKKPEAEKKPESEKKPEAEKKPEPASDKKADGEKKTEPTTPKNADGGSSTGPKGPPVAGPPSGGGSNAGSPGTSTPSLGTPSSGPMGGPPTGGPMNAGPEGNRSPAMETSGPTTNPGLVGGAPEPMPTPDMGAGPGNLPDIPGGSGPCLTCDIIGGGPPPMDIPDFNFYQPPEIYQPPELPPDLINSSTNLTVIINVQ